MTETYLPVYPFIHVQLPKKENATHTTQVPCLAYKNTAYQEYLIDVFHIEKDEANENHSISIYILYSRSDYALFDVDRVNILSTNQAVKVLFTEKVHTTNYTMAQSNDTYPIFFPKSILEQFKEFESLWFDGVMDIQNLSRPLDLDEWESFLKRSEPKRLNWSDIDENGENRNNNITKRIVEQGRIHNISCSPYGLSPPLPKLRS